MLPEIKGLEPELKQILYGCVEHVQATKAALYLSASRDLNEKTFELVTSYQFNDSARRVIRDNDDLVDRLGMKRAGWGIRHLGIEPSQNVAERARERGVQSLCRFFDRDLAAS